MDLNRFTNLALMYSGISGENRLEYIGKLDSLENTIRGDMNIDGNDSPEDTIQKVHRWLWNHNPNRFAEGKETDDSGYDYSRLDNVIDGELKEGNTEPIGICVGLVMEYMILTERLGVTITPMNFRGIETAHIFGLYEGKEREIYIDVTMENGIDLEPDDGAVERMQRLTKEQLLSVLVKNQAAQLGAKGDTYGAIAALQHALSLNPESSEAYYNLGVSYTKLGDTAEAIRCYQKAIEKFPKYALAQHNLGNIFLGDGDYQEAERWYREAIGSFDRYTPALVNLGASLILQGRIEEAGPYLRTALEIDPHSQEARVNLMRISDMGKA